MLELQSIDSDQRLMAHCVTARCTYGWFLEAIRGAEKNLDIQRNIIKGSKAYATLRADLERGCLLPPLVLAIKNVWVPPELEQPFAPVLDAANENRLLHSLAVPLQELRPENVYIIDGLQ